jgi:hypothetical protein
MSHSSSPFFMLVSMLPLPAALPQAMLLAAWLPGCFGVCFVKPATRNTVAVYGDGWWWL